MAMKIRISYKSNEELQQAIKLLGPIIKECKKSKDQNGEYLKAYIKTV